MWLGKLTALDMTPLGWLGRKTSTQTNKIFPWTVVKTSALPPQTDLTPCPLLLHLLVAGCDIGILFSVRPPVRPSVRPSVRLSTFMSTFDIYVKVSILINYKTKQPSNLAWNISLTSWLCNIGIHFSVCLSIRPSVCQHLCRSSTFMSKLVF